MTAQKFFPALFLMSVLFLSASAPGPDSEQAKRAEEALKSLGFPPQVEKNPIGERLQYRSSPKLIAGGTVLTVTVFIAPTEKQAREILEAVCGTYTAPTYGPADKIDVGAAEKASVFKSLGGWLPNPPYWIPYGHVGGHFLCGNVYAAVTQERAETAPLEKQPDAKASGQRLAAGIQTDVVELLKKLTIALRDKGACRIASPVTKTPLP